MALTREEWANLLSKADAVKAELAKRIAAYYEKYPNAEPFIEPRLVEVESDDE